MQNPDESTAHRLERRNDLRDENSTESDVPNINCEEC